MVRLGYLAGATKEQAAEYKLILLDKLVHTSAKTELSRLSAFWNYAIDHGQITTNIWDRLSSKLKDSKKKARVSDTTLSDAQDKADKLKDIGFWIQHYTRCRKGEHTGLRWCDIDMIKGTIRFDEYILVNIDRRLKGRDEDERIIPIHDKLRQKLLDCLTAICYNISVNPIWSEQCSQRTQVFGVAWSTRFSRNYDFTSHELRAHVVSQLNAGNISPYYLHEIKRHSVPGMSQVVAGYVRPTMDEFRDFINKHV